MKKDIPEPLNVTEQYLYAMTIRLDALCNMVDSLVTHIAEREGVATTNNADTSVDTQCTGKTRGGKRCKRTAEEGSAFCTTHQKG